MIQELKSLLADRQGFLEAMRASLSAEYLERLSRIFHLLDGLMSLLEQKNLSIARLRQLCFGASTESARNVFGGKSDREQKKPKARGHGRNSHRRYTGARRVKVSHPTLKAGQTCPECTRGKLRLRPDPAVAIAATAQPPVGAVIHEMEQLRCDTCGKLFTAPTPPEAGVEKYDPSVGVMVGLMRYGSGMPFYRLERLQKSLGVPLPASVQWEQARRVAQDLEPVYEHLIIQPVMEELRTWFAELIDGRKIEPNSGLGEAIAYMQKRWTQLTQFLRVPGAPLVSNEVERVLKTAILHRKNSLFYRSDQGAHVGDLFMSLVHTCRSHGVNPFDYMMAVVASAASAKADPGRWMPWNYQTARDEASALSV